MGASYIIGASYKPINTVKLFTSVLLLVANPTAPLINSETENEESEVPKKSQGNSIGARIQALTLFKLQVPHEKITAQNRCLKE